MAGQEFSSDGRYVFIMSRDGWVQEIRKPLVPARDQPGARRAEQRSIAMSFQMESYLAVANYLPNTLTILNASDLTVARFLR